jgi:cytidylate kinase
VRRFEMKIAVDGPAGAGKSTISKAVAKEMGCLYIDTGAMYRAVGLNAINNEVSLDDEASLTELMNKTDIKLKIEDDGQHILLNGEDVTGLIRTPQVSMAASKVSAAAGVRESLVQLQRKIAGENDVIMDGRDIGTTVLPDAEVKIYLTASVEDRAMRRYLEMKEKGESAVLEDVAKDIEQRDYNDMHRKVSPLKVADGAYVLDTSGMTLEESINAVKEYVGRFAE